MISCKHCTNKITHGSRSPKPQSFGFYMIINFNRFDKKGEMNMRECKYPLKIDMGQYISKVRKVNNDENKNKGQEDWMKFDNDQDKVDNAIYELIAVISHTEVQYL